MQSEPSYVTQRVLSLKALQRSRTTLEDFALTYLPLHGLAPEAILRWLDILVYVEALIYQMDEDNEECCSHMASHRDAPPPPHTGMQCIQQLLHDRGLWDMRIQAELESGLAYWAAERRLSLAMGTHAQPLQSPSPACTQADALHAHERKSFDYRVLHLLLHRLLGVDYDEALLAFCRVDEMLVDIGDDLTDYEDDVASNAFNIYRALLHVHGRDAPMQLIARIGALEQQHAALLAALPEGTRAAYAARQRSDAHAPGSERWVLPTPIWDEQRYRREVLQGDDDVGNAA